MIQIKRTTSDNKDFVQLVEALDAYLKITDGEEHEFYNQFNGIDILNHVIVAYHDGLAIGCGAFKHFDTSRVEIKRMYTSPEHRGIGVASEILKALELWALELHYISCVLETGIRQKEAVSFYKKNNYTMIPKYGQYVNMDNSLCFEKKLKQ
ncbi:GNAT family N-acetyltransferase [Psychroserpens sp. MEBiC05023]